MVQSIWIANNKTKYMFYHKQLVCMRTTLPCNDTVESDERKCLSVNTWEWWRQLSTACVLLAAETVRAMTHVINQGMAMYWGTSRWSPMEIMVRLSAIRYSHWLLIISLNVCGSLMEHHYPVFRRLTQWRDSSTRFLPSVSRLSTTCFKERRWRCNSLSSSIR